MKQGKPLITFVIVMLAVVLAVYLGYYVWDTFREPFTTTFVYAYTLNDSVETDGLIVRQEQVLPGAQGILDVTRGEGEKVGKGQTVALVYRDDQARQAQEQQEAVRMELTQLQYAMSQSGDVSTAARVDEEILQGLVSLRASSALGDYGDLEDQVLEVKSGVLRREYIYGADLSEEDLQLRLQQLKDQYNQLQSQNSAAITQVTAPVSGVFSAQVDGYENLVSLDTALTLTPTGVEDLLSQTPQADSSAAGKLITQNAWYFVGVVSAQEGERLEMAHKVTLRFAGDFTQDMEMSVLQVKPEGDQAVVVLSTDRWLEQTTLLRRQSAELIFESQSGLRVPKAALRMKVTETTDEETGETTENSTLGVYVITGGRAEFKAVKVLSEGSDFYVVESVATDKKALRSGDEIIVRATDLYDGKLLLY